MLLSFSVDEMRPMIEAGLRQRNGHDVGTARVKRQTIRALKARGKAILDAAKPNDWRCPYDLHLWWKSRTPARALLGVVDGARAMPVMIRHSLLMRGSVEIVTAVQGGKMDIIVGLPSEGSGRAYDFARADGFEGLDDFIEFFVPRQCDVFEGVLFTW